MTDSDSRLKFARVIAQFVNGELTCDEFDESGLEYSNSSSDPAIKAIHGMLWQTYSEGPHRLPVSSLNEYQKKLFDRCALFLHSNLEYQWPDDRGAFKQVDGLVFLDTFLDRIARLLGFESQAYVLEKEFLDHGDFSVWPFDSNDELEAEIKRREA